MCDPWLGQHRTAFNFNPKIKVKNIIMAFDEHLADRVVETGLSQGQWLTIPLILLGLIVILSAIRRSPLGSGGSTPAQA